MFIQLLLLPLLILVQFLSISAHKYGVYCNSDSDCDQHQKCFQRACRCNSDERRFWTGKICAICATGYTVTLDRCYKSFSELKTWILARNHCRVQYADLFTWRNNEDEQFIRPVIKLWATTSFFTTLWPQLFQKPQSQPYLSWAGASTASFNPYTIQWVDSAGLKLDRQSRQWCDPTKDAGYELSKEPTLGTKKGPNGDEREACVTYNFAGPSTSFLCLADDYCSQKYPFICEMNAASMELANSVHYGDNGDTSSGTGGDIDFEEQPPPPPPPTSDASDLISPSAHGEKSGMLSKSNMLIFTGIGIFLVVGAIAGYVVLQKRKANADDPSGTNGGVSQGRPSFASSIGSVME